MNCNAQYKREKLYTFNFISKNIFFAFLSALSISIYSSKIVFEGNDLLERLNNCINYIDFNDALCFFALLGIYLRERRILQKRIDILASIPALLFSGFMLIGKSYLEIGNWDFVLKDKLQIVIALIVLSGFFIMFYKAIRNLVWWVLTNSNRLLNTTEYKNKSQYKKISTYSWRLGFIILIICWLPYILINFPGSLPYDGFRQINMFMGVQARTNHHPYAITLLMGNLFKFGRILNDNFGVFLIVLFNCILSASIYSYICKKIYLWKFKVQVSWGVLLFFAIVPMWGAFVQAVIKDTIYISIFALYIVKLIDLYCYLVRKEGKKNIYFQYFLVSLCLILCRNNGIYIVIPVTLFFVLLHKKKLKILMMAIFVAIISFNWVYNSVFLPFCNVEPGSVKEMLSIPFQQTARYVRYFGDELDLDDKEAIDNVLDYSILASKYNPDKSDPIKDSMRNNVSKTDMKLFLKTWIKMLRQHPGVFIQATINNTYGYYYPFYQCKVLLTYNYYIEKKENVNTGDFNIHYLNNDNTFRDALIEYSDFWQIAPGISLFVSPGFYTWLLILMVLIAAVIRNWKMSIVLLALILHVGICFASPVNGLLRYAMPLMAAMPSCICWVIKEVNIQEKLYKNGK